jgi:transcription antitermination factor NusB
VFRSVGIPCPNNTFGLPCFNSSKMGNIYPVAFVLPYTDMKARSVAREFALLTLFQLETKGNTVQWEKRNLNELILDTVRTLSALACDQIEAVSEEIASISDFIVDHEYDHPINENVPVDLPTKPVPLPNSQEMVEKLQSLLSAVQNLQEAVYFPEMKTLADRDDVQNYCHMLIRNVLGHQAELDSAINDAAQDWRVERIQKMDLLLMRLALAEIRYSQDVDVATVMDEVLELAKRYTHEESRKFIHGVLGNAVGALEGA